MTVPSKPTLRPLTGEKIPTSLKAQKRWAPWRAVWNVKRGKYDKIPCALGGSGLSTAKPERWYTYTEALAAYQANPQQFAGVGYVMTGPHGVVGVDLDNCVHDNRIDPWAQEIIDRAGTYTELSPSQTGVRMFLEGATEVDWTNHDRGIEVYSGNEPRFLTVTGARLKTSAERIAPAAAGLLADLHQAFASAKQAAQIIDLNLPEIIDPLALPDIADLDLSYKVRDFLLDGTVTGDRSRVLHMAGIELCANGLTDAEVLSILVDNTYALEVALDHRRQDHDRAVMYLWTEHVQKARPKADARKFSLDDFEDVGEPNGELGGEPAGAASSPSAGAEQFEDVSGEAPPPGKLKYQFLQMGEFMRQVRRTSWLVHGVMPRAEIGVIFGDSGSGKSFFILDLLLAVARGIEWRGIRAKQGNVAYVVAEGAGGFPNRLEAYARQHLPEGASVDDIPLHLIGAAPNLMDKDDAKAIIASIKALGRVDVVVLDTMAQVTPGADENSGQDMGRALAHCKAIHKATGAMVLLIAHTGKDASRGIRGWSGIKGALDVEILVSKAASQRYATITKMKDGEGEGREYLFKLDTKNLGTYVDDAGVTRDITSCVVVHGAEQHVDDAPEKLTRPEHKAAWDQVEKLFALDPEDPELPKATVLAAIVALQTQPEAKARTRAGDRILDVLVKHRYVVVSGDVVRRAGIRK